MYCIQYLMFCLILLFIKNAEGCEEEKRLQEKLITNYNKLVRPVEKNFDTLDLKLGIKLIQLLDIDEKNQIMITKVWLIHIWRDINLKWDPSEYSNLTKISIPSTSIWVPDIILFNSADGKYEISLMTRAEVDNNGIVRWEPPAIYKSYCTIDVEFFPFDQQLCSMKFGSWTYDGRQVNLVHISQENAKRSKKNDTEIPAGIDLSDFHQNHEWDILSVPARRRIIPKYDNDVLYPEITFKISIRRKTLFYMCNLIIPCVCLTFLTVLTFFLPSESGEKISLCISILLSLTVFILLPNELIPPTSLVVPLIGKYLIFIIIILTLSISCTIFVLNVHFRSSNTHAIPKWARTLFLKVLPRFLLMKRTKFLSELATNILIEQLILDSIRNSNDDFVKMKKFKSKNPIGAIFKLDEKNLPRNSKKITIPFIYSKNKYTFMLPTNNKKEVLAFIASVHEFIRKKIQDGNIKQEWKQIALVIDRIFFLTFSIACLAGTIALLLQPPTIF